MNTGLPPVIAAFFHAHNTGQTDDFNQLFTDDALVSDESREYRGAAIKAWIDGAIAKYKPVADITDLTQVGEQTSRPRKSAAAFQEARPKFATCSPSETAKSPHWPSEHEPNNRDA